MTLHPRHTTTIVSAIALIAALSSPILAEDAMAPDAMSSDAMAMGGDTMASDSMSSDAMAIGDSMMMGGSTRTIMVTIENLLTGQPFSPSYFEAHAASAAPLYVIGEKASDALTAVAEGGNIGMFSVGAAKNEMGSVGDATLAIHTLPGQTRTLYIHVDEAHPLIDGVWMLGNTNDGFSGVSGVDAYALTAATTVEVLGYDAGSEINNEKKGFLGALGGGNDRDPENGVIAPHAGIRGDADAPKDWNWDVNAPVARVTFTPLN
jgi:pentapeptide MXKDX repeat protein